MRAVTIARLGGISIKVHPSWLLILALVSWTLADNVFPDTYAGWSTGAYWAIGVASALLLFVTVLLHELAHAVVAIRRGLPVPTITLFLFGGVSHLSRQPKTAREEFAIAIAGPLTSIAIALIAGVASLVAPNDKVEAILTYLATVNAILAIFNLLPGFPLDGGRVFRSIAWGKTKSFTRATMLAGRVGETCAYIMMAGGLILFVFGFAINGLWFLLIGWFLLSAARAEAGGVKLESALSKLRARDLMDVYVLSLPPETPLQVVVDEHVLGRGDRAVIIADKGSVRGILTLSDLLRVPKEQWPERTAGEFMTPSEQLSTVGPDTPAIEVLALIGQKSLNQVPVISDGHLLGVISRKDLMDRVQHTETIRGAR